MRAAAASASSPRWRCPIGLPTRSARAWASDAFHNASPAAIRSLSAYSEAATAWRAF